MIAYMKSIVQEGKEVDFDPFTLENEKTYSTKLTAENEKEIKAVMERDWMTWTATEGSLMTKFNKVNTDFRANFKPWISWHVKVIREGNTVQFNEVQEKSMGIDVAARTLPAPVEEPKSSST